MLTTILAAMLLLQPRIPESYAEEIGTAIHIAAAEHDIDPLLMVAIAFRESSFHPLVVRGERTGTHGEIGLYQIHPRGVALRFAPPGCRANQGDALCSARTAGAYLAHLRATGCPGSEWRWVAAYGRRSCPSEEEAREDRAAWRAFDLRERVE